MKPPEAAPTMVGVGSPARSSPRRGLPALGVALVVAAVAWVAGLGSGPAAPSRPALISIAAAPQTPWATTVELVQALNDGDVERASGIVGIGVRWFELPGAAPLVDAQPGAVHAALSAFVDGRGHLALRNCVWEAAATTTVVCDLEFTSGFSRAIEVTPLRAQLSVEFVDGVITAVRTAPTLAAVLSVLPQEPG